MSTPARLPRDHVAPPPPAVPPTPVTAEWKAGTEILRIYSLSAYTPDELSFRFYGPLLRFDHHRAPITAPAEDPERAIWYGAKLNQPPGMVSALEVCMWECFAAERRVDTSRLLGRVQVRAGEALRLLDLTGSHATDAGTIKQLANTPSPADSQEWSRYFYEHPQVYEEIDGLLFESAWCGGLNVALYERCRAKLDPVGIGSLALSNSALYGEVVTIAAKRGWSIAAATI